MSQMSHKEELGTCSFYLDEESFHICCQVFLQHSNMISDGWSWTEVKGVEGYMKKTVLIPRRCSLPNQLWQQKNDEDIDSLIEDQVDDDASTACAVCVMQDVILYEYHVLYSSSYQVPILFFTVSTLDGRLLSLEELWNTIHPAYKKQLLQWPWDTLTQQEHPILGQPFFMLHPCHTEEFMRPVLQMANAEKRRINYIVTWLSIVGPMVKLEVPISYCMAEAAST
ncbi:ubiquitin-like-conjugating enzyme ATG10 isoform X2 [Salminus brasiliensis]|uniref:ubiquitin-like-conjugating enzyme ATG10 isoform X2 n=1 Tax=Salminus brasiliensis TaxID=930266 RepID=UPI003B837970